MIFNIMYPFDIEERIEEITEENGRNIEERCSDIEGRSKG